MKSEKIDKSKKHLVLIPDNYPDRRDAFLDTIYK